MRISIIIVISILMASCMKSDRECRDLVIDSAKLKCNDVDCIYTAEIINNTNNIFSGFFHIFGYKLIGGERILSAEKREFITIDKNEKIMINIGQIHADSVDSSIRTNEYMAWLGAPCKNNGAYRFDVINLKFDTYSNYEDDTKSYSRYESYPMKKSSGGIYTALMSNSKYDFSLEINEKMFRTFTSSQAGSEYEGYLQPCDINSAKSIIENHGEPYYKAITSRAS